MPAGGAENSRYRGTVALHHLLLGPPDDVTVLALTGWDNSFLLHGIQPLPTPIPSGLPRPFGLQEAVTNTGTRHQSHGAGGHGHPRFLWHITFVPDLPAEATSLTLSGSTDETAFTTVLELPGWPPSTHDTPAQIAASEGAVSARPNPNRAGEPLPDRVIALNADLGVVANVRRVLTTLFCWPSWFLLTVEATGAIERQQPPALIPALWRLRDDLGNHYLGRWTGGWGGADSGAHIAFGPGLDPQARQLHLSFTDPFTPSRHLTSDIPVPRT